MHGLGRHAAADGTLAWKIGLLVLAGGALLPGVEARAQDENGRPPEGALFLLLPIGARAIAMGRAVTALRGPEAVFWNPAGLASGRGNALVFYRGDNVAGEGTSVSYVAASEGGLRLALSYHLNDVGDQTLTDEQGNPIGELTTRNHLGTLTLAHDVGTAVTLGANVKALRFQVSCRGTFCPDVGSSATSFAVDVGLTANPTTSLTVAAMLAHLGTFRTVTETTQERLPGRIRLAAAMDVTALLATSEPVLGTVSVEMQERLTVLGDPELYFGGEAVVGREDALTIRAGYVIGDEARAGARVGLGVRYGRVDLSIAKSLATSAVRTGTEPVHVTFALGL